MDFFLALDRLLIHPLKLGKTPEEWEEHWKRINAERCPFGCADVRGATIRPGVDARLGSLATDSTSHPMAAWGKGGGGLVWYIPAGEGKTDVYFAPVVWVGENTTTKPELTMLNEKTHSGRWPYVRVQPDGTRAFVVWEDSAPGRKSDVAFRASSPGMRQWGPVQYLTGHGAGVDDPVVHVNERGVVVVAWGDLRSGASQVFVRLSRDGGATFAPEVAIPRAPGEADTWPQVASPADGRLLAVWREGDGSDSEAWFASAPGPGQPWGTPLRVTNDKAYSEYPLVAVNGNKVWVSYHSDVSGLADLKYMRESTDNGRTWGEAVAMPSFEDVADRAWVEMNFSLQWSRSHYHPHNTYISVNGVLVGKLDNMVPEGTYVFPVPREAVSSVASAPGANRISVRIEGMNGANYLAAAKARLIIGRRFTQLPVVAESQAEADRVAGRSGAHLNHDRPDLALAANALSGLPDRVEPGRTVEVKLQALNLGEAPATDVRVGLYSLDSRDPLVDRTKARLAEERIGELKPGEAREVTLTFKFDSTRTPRIYAAVQGREEDYWTEDNVWGISFTQGESRSLPPVVGTDIPDVFGAPQLLDLVSLPDIPALQELLSVPGFESLVGIPKAQLPDVNELGGSLKRRLLPRPPGGGF